MSLTTITKNFVEFGNTRKTLKEEFKLEFWDT